MDIVPQGTEEYLLALLTQWAIVLKCERVTVTGRLLA